MKFSQAIMVFRPFSTYTHPVSTVTYAQEEMSVKMRMKHRVF